MSEGDPVDTHLTSEEKNHALAAHLAPLLVALLGLGVLAWAVPLWIWWNWRERSDYVHDQARESLNFRITLAVAYALSMVLIPIGVGILLVVLVLLMDALFTIIASTRANDGIRYRYPFVLRLVP